MLSSMSLQQVCVFFQLCKHNSDPDMGVFYDTWNYVNKCHLLLMIYPSPHFGPHMQTESNDKEKLLTQYITVTEKRTCLTNCNPMK